MKSANKNALIGAAQPPGHLDFLDGLRALAALYVVVHHLQPVLATENESFLYVLLHKAFRFGHQAVVLFIVLSGFCLMLPIVRNGGSLRGSAVDFFQRRAMRILPTYFLAIAFSMVLIHYWIGAPTGTNMDGSRGYTFWHLVDHLLLIQDLTYDSTYKINYALWSVSVEWRIYLLFPVLLWAIRRWGTIPVTLWGGLLAVAAWFGLQAWPDPSINKGLCGSNPHFVGLFMLGMLAAQVVLGKEAVWEQLRQRPIWNGLLIGLVVLFVGYQRVAWSLPWVYSDLLAGLAVTALLIALATNQARLLKRLLSWKPLVSVGVFAYSIYLIHAPVLELARTYFIQPLHLRGELATMAALVISLNVVLIVAYGFYLLAERPFQRINQRSKKVRAAVPALEPVSI